ncbi:hypothetical protein AC1031_020060 [Aphanomyces cochlioides]|nr:hypothetical protein AC1031_020060 [Aphanomyces cochlioides]
MGPLEGLPDKLEAVRALQRKLHVAAAPSHWSTSPAASSIEKYSSSAHTNGGVVQLDGMEHVVLDFLGIPELLVGALVCKRWYDLCRDHTFWEKSLVTPVERHSLRVLLACPSIPAMHVAMLFRESGLYRADLRSIHVTGVYDGKISLRKWMADAMLPLSDNMLRSFCFQILHGLVALERSGLKPRDVSTQCIAVAHPAKNASPGSVPVLQVMDDHLVESNAVPPAQYFEERDEALFLLVYRGMVSHKQTWRNAMCGFLYTILELALHGRVTSSVIAQVQYRMRSVLETLHVFQHLLPRDLVSLIEYGAFVRRDTASLTPLLKHGYFTKMGDTLQLPVVTHERITGPLMTMYMDEIIKLWEQTTQCRALTEWSVLTPVWNQRQEPSGEQTMRLMRQRWHSYQVPANATREWLALLVITQKATLVRVDLSAASQLATSTVLQALMALPMLREVKLASGVLRHCSMERVVASSLPLRVVDPSFAHALLALERAYEAQMCMMRYTLSRQLVV